MSSDADDIVKNLCISDCESQFNDECIKAIDDNVAEFCCNPWIDGFAVVFLLFNFILFFLFVYWMGSHVNSE